MLHRFRSVLVRPGRERLLGRVEADETCNGGQEPGLTGGWAKGKKILTGIAVESPAEGGPGRCRMAPLPDAKAVSLRAFIQENVEPGSVVVTDGWNGYRGISTDVTHQTASELEQYFAGELTDFTVPIEPGGTAFQRVVWDELGRIPFGTTRSYAEQAKRIGRPEAVRAVARANGDNRIAIIIPCHRVVGSDGKLTGYGGGLWRKRRLLHLEQGVLSFM